MRILEQVKTLDFISGFHWSALEFSETFASVFTGLWRHGKHVLFLNWNLWFEKLLRYHFLDTEGMTVATMCSTPKLGRLCTMSLHWELCTIVTATLNDFTTSTQMTFFAWRFTPQKTLLLRDRFVESIVHHMGSYKLCEYCFYFVSNYKM